MAVEGYLLRKAFTVRELLWPLFLWTDRKLQGKSFKPLSANKNATKNRIANPNSQTKGVAIETKAVQRVAWTPRRFSARSHGPSRKRLFGSGPWNLGTSRKAAESSGYPKSSFLVNETYSKHVTIQTKALDCILMVLSMLPVNRIVIIWTDTNKTVKV